MSLMDDVTAAWKDAMKARDPKKDTLSMIRTELKNHAIATRSDGDKGTELADDEAMKVLGKMAKQRRESIAEYESAGRDDLAKKEKDELATIESFLPAQLGDDELEAIVKQVIADTGAESMKEMGKVMGPTMQKVGGQADGKRVQAVVKALLG